MGWTWLLAATTLFGWTDGSVRSQSDRIRQAMEDAARRSTTFRRLLHRVGASNLIAYVESGDCHNADVLSCLIMPAASGPTRYLRIVIDTRHSRQLIQLQIAHELQHAVEIAEAREVVDLASLRALYERIGTTNTGPNVFETRAAVQTALAVSRELAAPRRRCTGAKYPRAVARR